MDKKKLKNLLCFLGIIFLIGAVIATYITGTQHTVLNYRYDEHMKEVFYFLWDLVEWNYVIPLGICGLLCFGIGICINPNNFNGKKDAKENTSVVNNSKESVDVKLEKLKNLLDKKLISEDEYNQKRSDILSKEL